MSLEFTNKTINVNKITCDGTVEVTLEIGALPDISKKPADMVLLLDKSGSMEGRPLEEMKEGAKRFIDIMDKATDSIRNGAIGGGSRIGIVSFETAANKDSQLITDTYKLKCHIEGLYSQGSTNHAEAFEKALELFEPTSSNEKIIIMFTDGKTTVGTDPNIVATLAKNSGVKIYCIGLMGEGGIEPETLNAWASQPSSKYVAIAPKPEELEAIFEDLAKDITKTGATNIVIDEVINTDFMITNIFSPNKGTIQQLDNRTIKWSIDKLGEFELETAKLVFLAKHIGNTSVTKNINESITYTDAEGNQANFPNPTIEIDCGVHLNPELCPNHNQIVVEKCLDEYIESNLNDVYLDSNGKILEVKLKLKSICPNKRVALAVLLTEKDALGNEQKRGMKIMTIPAHQLEGCKDINVEKIRFILPDDISLANNCEQRLFNVRAMAHYVDSGYHCADLEI